MLSRVANALYWMVRYIERADNLARLIDVNQQLLLDVEAADRGRQRALWRPIVASTGDEALFDELHAAAKPGAEVRFLTDDRRNPNCIVSCLMQARENARTVRDQLSDDLWEELNALYLFATSDDAARVMRRHPARFYEGVRRGVQTFLGIADSSIGRSEAWEFMQLGRYLERADKTTRFLDITSHLPRGEALAGRSGIYGPAILRSCSALGAYRAEHRGEINTGSVARFLLFSATFPRSVRFCVDRINESLHRISGSPHGGYANAPERLCGLLRAALNYATPDEVFGVGLHEYLDALQQRFNEIGEAVFESYVLMADKIAVPAAAGGEPLSAARRWELEQMQQQQ